MDYTISDGIITLTVSSHGAEAVSLVKGGAEYLWKGDGRYWGRHAPVLFPFVGQVREKTYRFRGREYHMGQHGFARDMEFNLISKTSDTFSFELDSDAETREKYPFDFVLVVSYRLEGSSVNVSWNVKNTGSETMYFSIGGHPAFMCPLNGQGDWPDYRIHIMKGESGVQEIKTHPITTGGNVGSEYKDIALSDGYITPTDELFAGDALILEDSQADTVALTDPEGRDYLTVRFDTPLVGIWSPAGKHAPFICIEPWYGRTDADDFTGDLTERPYTNVLSGGDTFTGGFSVHLR